MTGWRVIGKARYITLFWHADAVLLKATSWFCCSKKSPIFLPWLGREPSLETSTASWASAGVQWKHGAFIHLLLRKVKETFRKLSLSNQKINSSKHQKYLSFRSWRCEMKSWKTDVSWDGRLEKLLHHGHGLVCATVVKSELNTHCLTVCQLWKVQQVETG